jgi:hypothetical protein
MQLFENFIIFICKLVHMLITNALLFYKHMLIKLLNFYYAFLKTFIFSNSYFFMLIFIKMTANFLKN